MAHYSNAYQIEVRHAGLNKYRMLRGTDSYVLEQRAEALKAQWDDMWARQSARENASLRRFGRKAEAEDRTKQAREAIDQLQSLLRDGIQRDQHVHWEALKDRSQFAEAKPVAPNPPAIRAAPEETSAQYRPKSGILEFIFPERKRRAAKAAADAFANDRQAWTDDAQRTSTQFEADQAAHTRSVSAWELRKAAFLEAQVEQHQAIDKRAAAAADGTEGGISEMLDLALTQSPYPDFLNVNFELDYAAATKTVVIDYTLPAPEDLPSLKELRFVQARDELTEKHLTDAERAKLYDSVLYQIALRSLFTVFGADTNGFVDRATFNGWVDYIDRSTGMDERSCILTVGVNRGDFDRVDLDRVDPKDCFRSWKGVAASKLIGLAPVAPLERPRLTDRRFIESREVAAEAVGMNIAAMDWKDFEHLVRQVFEHEFSTLGSEVRVTQASRDGGVDAIVFDPDPIKGGKIVIQAKRYTNTVEVSAVRDLYGTVVNEGASKGILVTTSQYGPDARKFAQGKPITLIDGSNFLFLLERMGVEARIDLREAKALHLAQLGPNDRVN